VSRPGFATAMVASLLMGIVLNYTMFLCTMVNSALTTTIVGVLKGVVTTVSAPRLRACLLVNPCCNHPPGLAFRGTFPFA